jgi:hypothetical protein
MAPGKARSMTRDAVFYIVGMMVGAMLLASVMA